MTTTCQKTLKLTLQQQTGIQSMKSIILNQTVFPKSKTKQKMSPSGTCLPQKVKVGSCVDAVTDGPQHLTPSKYSTSEQVCPTKTDKLSLTLNTLSKFTAKNAVSKVAIKSQTLIHLFWKRITSLNIL